MLLGFTIYQKLLDVYGSSLQRWGLDEEESVNVICETAQKNINNAYPLHLFSVRHPQPVTNTSVHLRKPTYTETETIKYEKRKQNKVDMWKEDLGNMIICNIAQTV